MTAHEAGPKSLDARNDARCFLDPEGLICLRLSADDRTDVISAGGAAVVQYGRNMPDFASVPPSAVGDELDALFAQSWDHAGTLTPK